MDRGILVTCGNQYQTSIAGLFLKKKGIPLSSVVIAVSSTIVGTASFAVGAAVRVFSAFDAIFAMRALHQK